MTLIVTNTSAEEDASMIKPTSDRITSEAVTEVETDSEESHNSVTESASNDTYHDAAQAHSCDNDGVVEECSTQHQQEAPHSPTRSTSSTSEPLSPRQKYRSCTFAELEDCDDSEETQDSTSKSDSPFNPQTLQLNTEYTKRVLKYAQRRLDKCGVVDYYEEQPGCIEVVEPKHAELSLGNLLGQGSFSAVYSVRKAGGNKFCKNTALPKDQIVVKILRKKLLQKPAMLAACVADLIKEGLLLAALTQSQDQHRGKRHILQVHGWTPTLLQGFANGRHDAFFLILQKLDYTLSHKLEHWRRQRTVDVTLSMVQEQFPSLKKHKARKLKFWKKNAAAAQLDSSSHNPSTIPLHMEQLAFWQRRLQLVIDLSHAVEYLHSKRILHRDLKPDNIGFEDANGLTSSSLGVLKVFDFDVARILPEEDVSKSTLPLFQLTKRVGSPRYMSPECARGDPYNEKADVYTVGLLCYELLSLIKPYHDISPEQHDEAIFHKGARPVLPKKMDHDKAVQVAAVLAKKMEHVNSANGGRISAAKAISQKPAPAKQPHVQFWSSSLQELVQRMWSQTIDARPTMTQARHGLEQECREISMKLAYLEAQLEQQWTQQVEEQQVDLSEVDVQEPAVVKTVSGAASKPTRSFSLRLWKSSANNGSNSKLNRSRHGSMRSRTSSMGGTSRTAGVTSTTGLSSSNFASFNNLAALNTLQEQN